MSMGVGVVAGPGITLMVRACGHGGGDGPWVAFGNGQTKNIRVDAPRSWKFCISAKRTNGRWVSGSDLLVRKSAIQSLVCLTNPNAITKLLALPDRSAPAAFREKLVFMNIMQIKKFGIAVALVAIASCGSDTSNESGSTLDRKTLTDETQKAIDDLHWPNGKAPSAELVLGPELKRADGGDESVTWQTGFGRMQASLYYECIWAIQVLDAPDEATRGKYLEQLASDQTYVEWQSSAPDFKAMIDESQRAAAAGDLSAIESAVATGGCRDWEAGVFH